MTVEVRIDRLAVPPGASRKAIADAVARQVEGVLGPGTAGEVAAGVADAVQGRAKP